jgi:hypothetical protein
MLKVMFVMMVMVLTMNAVSHAGVKVVGKEGSREFDSSGFPPDKKASYKLMKTYCTKCHTLDRVVQAVETGIAPNTWQPFDQKAAKTYVERMMRKNSKNMPKEEVKAIVDLLQWLIVEANKK